jgi:peptide-methionine (S)-S-oxide reductase
VRKSRWSSPLAVLLLALCAAQATRAATEASPPAPAGLAKATFAGGCFWCMEQPFEALAGVKSAISGYTGGTRDRPAYRQVSGGSTGHAEAVEVLYDPAVVGYERLLEVFWANIDPTVENRQFCDVGSEYRTAIFAHDAAQRAAAEASLAKWKADPRFAGQTLYTQVVDASTFWVAEDYHQDYAAKNPAQYKYYRWGCGRDARLKQVWGAAPG